MRTHRLMVTIVFSAGCVAGAAWTVTHIRVSHRIRPAATQQATPEVVPAALEVSSVDATQTEDTPNSEGNMDWEARQRFDEAAAQVSSAREQLQSLDARIAAARTQVVELEYRLIAARDAELTAETAVADSDRRYRQGMLGELEHDRILADRQMAIEQLERQRSQADLASRSVEELESDRLDALSNLHEARERWRGLAANEAAGPALLLHPR